MSELPAHVAPAREPVPRESACGILVRRPLDGELEVLLGLRSRSTRFLPGQLAFPGGRLESSDEHATDRAHARCATRELQEETGIRVPPTSWYDAGERVTPPMFPVRFRTRFLLAELPEDPPAEAPAPAEIEALRVARPAEFLEAWVAGRVRVPPPVLPILRVLAEASPAASLPEIAREIAAANVAEEHAPRIEFAPDVWAVPLRAATLPPATHTNAWLAGGREFVIVDPGSNAPEELERLLHVVVRRSALGDRVRAVVLTHHHGDHVAGATNVARSLGLPVRAHAATLERVPLRDVPTSAIEDGEDLDLQGLVLRAHHTPGHAPGHLAFEILGRGELIAGDLVSGLSTILVPPGDGDMGQYLDSLERMSRLGCHTLLPAHGAPVPGRALDETRNHRREREQRILAQLGAQATDIEKIARGAYDDLPELPAALAEQQTLAHLLHLERGGGVRRFDPAGRAWARDVTSPPGGNPRER